MLLSHMGQTAMQAAGTPFQVSRGWGRGKWSMGGGCEHVGDCGGGLLGRGGSPSCPLQGHSPPTEGAAIRALRALLAQLSLVAQGSTEWPWLPVTWHCLCHITWGHAPSGSSGPLKLLPGVHCHSQGLCCAGPGSASMSPAHHGLGRFHGGMTQPGATCGPCE